MRKSTDALRSLARYTALVLDEIDDQFETRLAFEEVDLEPPFAVVDAVGAERMDREGSLVKQTQPFSIQVYPRPREYVEDSRNDALEIQDKLWQAFELGRSYLDVQTELDVPTGLAAVPSASGGTLDKWAYYYVVTAFDSEGETLPSDQLEVLTTPPHASVALAWDEVTGAEGYRVWRSPTHHVFPEYIETADPELLDTGSSGTIGVLPAPVTSGARRVPLYDYDEIDLLSPTFTRFPHDFMRVEDHSEQRIPDDADPRRIRIVVDIRCSWRRVGRVSDGRRATEPARLRYRLRPS